MPKYDVVCPNCGVQEIVARMSEAAAQMPCPVCQRPRPQIFHVPQFQEDRTRLWKGPLQNGWSTALGEYMPQSRSERDKLAKKKGVEFCSLAELKADNKEAREAIEYTAEVAAGGKRDEPQPAPANVWQSAPSWAKDLV